MSNVIKRLSHFLRSPKDKETLITSLSTQIPEPTPTQVQEIQNVEYDLHVLRSQRIADYSQTVYVAPMAKPSLHASGDILFPLMDKVKDFLTSDCQVMLILGDPGAGKSTFSRQLEYVLWQEYIPGGRIPLSINLVALEQPRKRHRQFTLICEGYDESQLRCNLHTTNLLNQSGMRDSKLIITCRSQYLGPDYRDLFVPQGDRFFPVSPKAQSTSQDYE
ncbi:hypothetical protein BGX24_008494 [Mortierella sp. AD032]|nr:hypothetical protein BGX24_008494 [Mortierella sp. AD032]